MPIVFENLARSGGKNISVQYVNKGSATISDYASSETDHGAKAHDLLLSQKYDYVIVEPSRRITHIENSVFNCELAALKAIYPTLHQETSNIYLMAYAADSTASVFTTEGGALEYTNKLDSTGTKVTEAEWSKAIGCQFYADLATTWTEEVNKLNSAYTCKAYKYSLVYAQSGGPKKATIGYMMGASLYMTLFGKTYTDTTVLNSVTYTEAGVEKTSTMTSTQAATLRGYAENICLPSA